MDIHQKQEDPRRLVHKQAMHEPRSFLQSPAESWDPQWRPSITYQQTRNETLRIQRR